MKNKFFGFFLAFVLACGCAMCLTACGGKGSLPNRIESTLPNKVWVEYGGIVFAKEGNDVYVESGVYSMSGRGEVYIRENLTTPAATDGMGNEQYYITARYYERWIYADNDGIKDLWHANSDNHSAMAGYVNSNSGPYTSAYMFRGYATLNAAEGASNVATQLANETISIGGSDVECIVWEYVFDYNGTWSKTKYYYAADSHVFLKEIYTSDKNANINTDGIVEREATLYRVGVSLEDVLTAKGKTMPVFASTYH